VSKADFTFFLLAIDWGWVVEEAAARLLQESAKAQENGEAYAQRTARSAARALERRRGESDYTQVALGKGIAQNQHGD
jgi:hypothetical protein